MNNKTILSLIIFILVTLGIYKMLHVKSIPISLNVQPVTTPAVETPATTSQKISLLLESDGLGGLKFGATQEDVLTTLSRVIGTSTKDTGWTSSNSEYGSCPGKEIRVIEWNRLRVFLGDTKYGTKTFFQFEYTDRDTKNPVPVITTSEGITLGSTKAEVQKAYPNVKITPWTENYEQYERFTIDDSLKGTLKNGKVFWINAGVECRK